MNTAPTTGHNELNHRRSGDVSETSQVTVHISKSRAQWRLLLVAMLLGAFAALAGGGELSRAQVVPPLDDPAALAEFFDREMAAQMAEHGIAGGAIAVVKDGSVLFQKGFGHADVEAERPVDPETTMFRVGSVGKLFTATAVMQLVEQGQLDLDEDVNAYLDFAIPETYDEPVTLAHLLTHTAGFEARWIGMWPDSEEGVEPLGEWLRDHRPARVRPPGIVVSYSNYGMSLAGYIVERVSGLAYGDYVEQHILAPLGMDHSTASQPVRSRSRNISRWATSTHRASFVRRNSSGSTWLPPAS